MPENEESKKMLDTSGLKVIGTAQARGKSVSIKISVKEGMMNEEVFDDGLRLQIDGFLFFNSLVAQRSGKWRDVIPIYLSEPKKEEVKS